MIGTDDLGQILSQKRFATREQQQTDRRQRLEEPADFLERQLFLALIDRVEAVPALGVAGGRHEVRPLRNRLPWSDQVARQRRGLTDTKRGACHDAARTVCGVARNASRRALKNPMTRATSPAASHGKSTITLPNMR